VVTTGGIKSGMTISGGFTGFVKTPINVITPNPRHCGESRNPVTNGDCTKSGW